MLLLGYDIGSSSVKASLMDAETGNLLGSAFHPKNEMPIVSVAAGFAEQDPEAWFKSLTEATMELMKRTAVKPDSIKAIGISYQMHGLVVVDKNLRSLRPSIIWCDSRAVPIGDKAFHEIGPDRCLSTLLNSPGNFTASKLKWVKDYEPALYEKIYKIMLPGDFIAMKLSGEVLTTPSGLSEGIMWDFNRNNLSAMVIDHFGFDRDLLPAIAPNFSYQGSLSAEAASLLGLEKGIPITYRAGDQPNNAFSLNVLNPGEVAATAGTSGVVYGVSDVVSYDPESRVNTFAHVNHTPEANRLGVLLCVNGTGILNSWLRKHLGEAGAGYVRMNELASQVAVGSDGLVVLPFGNGAERMLSNKDLGCTFDGLDFNRHSSGHLIRAAHEGIAFSFKYGMDIMKQMGITPQVIRAGDSNMFMSPIFRQTLANISGNKIELYNTDGSQGSARAAGLGAGIYRSTDEAFNGLKVLHVVEPQLHMYDQVKAVYQKWKNALIIKMESVENQSC